MRESSRHRRTVQARINSPDGYVEFELTVSRKKVISIVQVLGAQWSDERQQNLIESLEAELRQGKHK